MSTLLCLIILMFSPFQYLNSITEIYDLSQFEKTAQNLDQDSLVLLDIDYTVIVPSDASLLPCGYHLRKEYLHSCDAKKREMLQAIIAIEGKEQLHDPLFLSIINSLHAHNVPVIGLTALETGAYGKIPHLEDWRLSVLKNLGVNFSTSYPAFKELQFSELPPYHGNYPLFKEGVLFTNRRPKGEVVTAFITHLTKKPKQVVFIDDALEYLKSVENAAHQLGITFIGFHYKAIANKTNGFDEKIGRFQFQYLLQHNHWLSDEQANSLLHDSKGCKIAPVDTTRTSRE